MALIAVIEVLARSVIKLPAINSVAVFLFLARSGLDAASGLRPGIVYASVV